MAKKDDTETSEQKTEKKKVKVTTGAWWKLSFRKNKAEKTAEDKAEKSTGKKTAPKKRPAKPVEKKIAEQSPPPLDEKENTTVAGQAKPETQEIAEQNASQSPAASVPKKKQSRGRRGRKPKQQKLQEQLFKMLHL